MAVGTLMAFWALSFVLVLTPGADWAYTISSGIVHRTVAPAIAGLLVGYVLITLVVAGGAAAVIASTPGAMTVLTLVGSAYLAWLGLGTFRNPPTVQAATDDDAATAVPQATWMSQIKRGAAVSGLNPKAMLLFLALMPQFTNPHGSWPVPVQIGTLGLTHMASCLVVYACVGMAARAVLSSRPAAAMAVGRVSGVAMMVIAAILVAEQLAH